MGRKVGSTNAMREIILQDCMRCIIDGGVSAREWQKIAKEKHNIGQRQAYRYWKAAWEYTREKYDEERDDLVAASVAKLDRMFDEVSKQGYDYNTQLNILREKHKLLGLYIEKQQIGIGVDKNIKFDFGIKTKKDDE
jgi:uncharacterized membrane protein YgaE (UPF0421/DUF939 family)